MLLIAHRNIVWFQKISIYLPQGWFFGLDPPTPWNFQFSFLLSFKNLGYIYLRPNSLPFGISNDHPCGGYGYFLEPNLFFSLV